MGNKLNRNQWIAVILALLAVVAILSASFRISLGSRIQSVLNDPNEELNEGENNLNNNSNMSEANKWIPDFDAVNAGEDSFRSQDLVEGEGKEAVEGSAVTVNYEGFLVDGTKFDSSWDRGLPFGFVLGSGMVIQGWDQGVLGMKEGGVRMLVIPAEMGYGDREIGPIPANSTLVFIVRLLEVK